MSGATSGHLATVDLRRVFALQLEILGTIHGYPGRTGRPARPVRQDRACRPVIDSVLGFSDVRQAFERLHSGDVFGKVVLDHTR